MRKVLGVPPLKSGGKTGLRVGVHLKKTLVLQKQPDAVS